MRDKDKEWNKRISIPTRNIRGQLPGMQLNIVEKKKNKRINFTVDFSAMIKRKSYQCKYIS